MGAGDEESADCEDDDTDTELETTAALQSKVDTLHPIPENTPLEILTGIIAAASVAVSTAAMILQPTNLVFAAGGLSCAIGPYAYYQQKQLTDIVAMQETHAALSEQVDRLGQENNRLHNTVVDLSATVDRLEDVEQALDAITQQQGMSIEALEEQVKDNRDILRRMQSGLKANILQNLLQVVIRSDKDGSMTVGEHEIDELMVKLEEIDGVTVNEEPFKKVVLESGGSLQSIMNLIKSLMNDTEFDGDEIFFINYT